MTSRSSCRSSRALSTVCCPAACPARGRRSSSRWSARWGRSSRWAWHSRAAQAPSPDSAPTSRPACRTSCAPPSLRSCSSPRPWRSVATGSVSDYRREAGVIVQEGRRLLHLVENVLHVSRAERAAPDVSRASAPLAPFVRRALEGYAPLATAHGATIRAEIDERVTAPADGPALERVVVNLLDNAVKYAGHAGPVTLAVELAADHAEIRVDDSGPGVPPADRQPHLGAVRPARARPRRRADRRRSRTHRGARHRPEPRRHRARGGIAARRRTVRDPPSRRESRRPGVRLMRVLVVEDNANLARGLRHNLELEGYEVEVAYDGATGLALARTERADLVILDLMIPRPDGYQLLRTLRDESIQTPVVVLTARGDEADKLRGFRLGADDYVTKPFSLLELLARVEAVLRRARGESGSAEPAAPVEFGNVRVEPDAHRVLRAGAPVDLRPKEFQLLLALARRDGSVATRTELLDEVWGYEADVVSRTVDTHVAELRRKLEPEPAAPRHILTVRKVGYRLQR